MILLIDFDRTIHSQKQGYGSGVIYDKPTDFCVEALKLLKEKYTIYIFTARNEEDYPEIERWLKVYDIPYDKITNKKVGGIIIDDKAIRFTNWRDILNYFVEW